MKKIYLTFDDGPNEYTLSILKALKIFGAKALSLLLEKLSKISKNLKKDFFALLGEF